MTKQQQQQPQHEPQPTCTRCGGSNFFHTPIMDPKAGRMANLYQCKSCDNMQWSPWELGNN